MFEDTFPPDTISPALLSSAHTTPSLVNDNVSNTSAVAMSPNTTPPASDATTPTENACACCKKTYLISTISDDLLCHDCTWFLENSEPQTEKEIELERIVRNFSDDDIRAVGLGNFFELQGQPTTEPLPQYNPTPSANVPSSSHVAQMAALNSQMLHQRKNSTGNPSHTVGFIKPPVVPSMPLSRTQGRGNTSSTPVTEETIRQWASAHPTNSSIPAGATSQSRTNSKPLPQPHTEYMRDIFESPSVQAEVKKATKKRGPRMICATCEKDSPISNKNDGVNCTRCFAKLKRAEAVLPISPDVGGEKRAYDSAFDGYSPADGSPSKFTRRL